MFHTEHGNLLTFIVMTSIYHQGLKYILLYFYIQFKKIKIQANSKIKVNNRFALKKSF